MKEGEEEEEVVAGETTIMADGKKGPGHMTGNGGIEIVETGKIDTGEGRLSQMLKSNPNQGLSQVLENWQWLNFGAYFQENSQYNVIPTIKMYSRKRGRGGGGGGITHKYFIS